MSGGFIELNPEKIIPTISEGFTKTYTHYQKTIITAFITSMMLLITLAWNDVVQAIIQQYYPKGNTKTIMGKVYYAMIITIIIVLLQLYVFPLIIPNGN
jgi:hypothetical protein